MKKPSFQAIILRQARRLTFFNAIPPCDFMDKSYMNYASKVEQFILLVKKLKNEKLWQWMQMHLHL